MITKSIKNPGKRYTSITPFFEHDHWLKITAKLKQFGKKI
jgi:UDP-3-O-[3-hydroxymyristoyl] glucosamine N-acyltransferase